MNVDVLLFDGFDELDAIGPYETLSNASRFGAEVTVRTVTLDPAETVVASHGLEVVPDGTLDRPDLLIVPGGGWTSDGGVRREFEDGALGAAIADAADAGATVASVCTGAMLLCDAGLLDGRPATTHHAAVDDLDDYADRVSARVVDDGDVLTAGGVTAGLDLAAHLLDREFGPDVADGVTREMEYEPRGDVYRRVD